MFITPIYCQLFVTCEFQLTWNFARNALVENIFCFNWHYCLKRGYTEVCNHPQPPTTIHDHPHLPATIHNHLQQSTTPRNRPKPPKNPPTTIHNHPQPPKITQKAKICHKKLCYCILDVNTETDADFDSEMKQWYIYMSVRMCVYTLYTTLYLVFLG